MNTQTQEALKMAIEVMYRNSPKIGLTQELEEAINACKEALNIANCDLKQPAQEPVAVKNVNGITLKQGWDDLPDDTLLYTHPHQWQGLTDDEIAEVLQVKTIHQSGFYEELHLDEAVNLYRAIEQALKEKNT
jgi:hypothetical protein